MVWDKHPIRQHWDVVMDLGTRRLQYSDTFLRSHLCAHACRVCMRAGCLTGGYARVLPQVNTSGSTQTGVRRCARAGAGRTLVSRPFHAETKLFQAAYVNASMMTWRSQARAPSARWCWRATRRAASWRRSRWCTCRAPTWTTTTSPSCAGSQRHLGGLLRDFVVFVGALTCRALGHKDSLSWKRCTPAGLPRRAAPL